MSTSDTGTPVLAAVLEKRCLCCLGRILLGVAGGKRVVGVARFERATT